MRLSQNIMVYRFQITTNSNKRSINLQSHLQMNNASCYANWDKYVFDSSDAQQQWEVHNANFIKINKSVSLQNCQQILSKPHQHLNIKHNKKTQSFMMPPKNNKANGGNTAKPKNKTNKRQTNTSLTLQTPKKNNKISLNKTTVSVNRSSKSSKGSKTRSNMNRDYLIVNETIYECQNMEEITSKMIYGEQKFFTYGRYCKTMMKLMGKFQQYLFGFRDFVNFRNKNSLRLSKLTQKQKSQLYLLLQEQKNDDSELQIEDLMKEAVSNVQIKADQMVKQQEKSQLEAIQWKSEKLHQLMAANSFLCNNFTDLTENGIGKDMEILFMDSPPVNEKQRKFKEEDKYRFIEESAVEKRLSIQAGNILLFTNINGIQKFMMDLFDFLAQNSEIEGIVEDLHERYGLNQKDKQNLYQMGMEEWGEYIFEKEEMSKSIIPDSIFVNLSKQIGEKILDNEQQSNKYLHIFHKSIFDCINQLLPKFQPQYPFGPVHPFDRFQNLAFYIIDEENFGCVWNELTKEISSISKTLMGLMVDSEEGEEESEKYEEKTFMKTIKKEIKQDFSESFYSIGCGQVIFELGQVVEEELWREFIFDTIGLY